MPGGSILKTLDSGHCFTEYECAQIFAQTADAIRYLHEQDPPIVHRDIKPENIMIRDHNKKTGVLFVLFADFGLSNEGPEFITKAGTERFQAPELLVASEWNPYSPIVDVWSLGMTMALLVLPRLFNERYHSYEKLIEEIKSVNEKINNGLLVVVIKSMLVPQALRRAAKICSIEAVLLLRIAKCAPKLFGEIGEMRNDLILSRVPKRPLLLSSSGSADSQRTTKR